MTERGQLATEAQRNDMDTLVERLEGLRANEQLGPFEDEDMVKPRVRYCPATVVLGLYVEESGRGPFV